MAPARECFTQYPVPAPGRDCEDCPLADDCVLASRLRSAATSRYHAATTGFGLAADHGVVAWAVSSDGERTVGSQTPVDGGIAGATRVIATLVQAKDHGPIEWIGRGAGRRVVWAKAWWDHDASLIRIITHPVSSEILAGVADDEQSTLS